eukprot:scaffold3650_cov58-Phaeocystis_antarctica.AAC.2
MSLSSLNRVCVSQRCPTTLCAVVLGPWTNESIDRPPQVGLQKAIETPLTRSRVVGLAGLPLFLPEAELSQSCATPLLVWPRRDDGGGFRVEPLVFHVLALLAARSQPAEPRHRLAKVVEKVLIVDDQPWRRRAAAREQPVERVAQQYALQPAPRRHGVEVPLDEQEGDVAERARGEQMRQQVVLGRLGVELEEDRPPVGAPHAAAEHCREVDGRHGDATHGRVHLWVVERERHAL